MRASQEPPPKLVVVRSEADTGRVGLRLIGDLDLHTVDVLEDELMRTRAQAPPRVIDLSELRFLDLTGLRALSRAAAGSGDGANGARLVGATGIVRRLIELSLTIDASTEAAGGLASEPAPPAPAGPTTTVAAERIRDEPERVPGTGRERLAPTHGRNAGAAGREAGRVPAGRLPPRSADGVGPPPTPSVRSGTCARQPVTVNVCVSSAVELSPA